MNGMKSVTIRYNGRLVIRVVNRKDGTVEAEKSPSAKDSVIEVRDEKGRVVKL